MTDLQIALVALDLAQRHLVAMRAEAERALNELHAAIDLVESGARCVAKMRGAEETR